MCFVSVISKCKFIKTIVRVRAGPHESNQREIKSNSTILYYSQIDLKLLTLPFSIMKQIH